MLKQHKIDTHFLANAEFSAIRSLPIQNFINLDAHITKRELFCSLFVKGIKMPVFSKRYSAASRG